MTTKRQRVHFCNSHVQRIGQKDVALTCGAESITLPNDFVFVLIGGESPEEFLRKVGIEIVEKAIGAPAF